MSLVDKQTIRKAAQSLDTEAEELYVRACQTFDRRRQNKILTERAKLSRLARELRHAIGDSREG